jgi:hypothetical protein
MYPSGATATVELEHCSGGTDEDLKEADDSGKFGGVGEDICWKERGGYSDG